MISPSTRAAALCLAATWTFPAVCRAADPAPAAAAQPAPTAQATAPSAQAQMATSPQASAASSDTPAGSPQGASAQSGGLQAPAGPGIPPPVIVTVHSKDGIAPDQHFQIDPVSDGTLIGMGLGVAIIDDLILGTGEITPQRPGDPNRLLSIDRSAVTQTFDNNASQFSNLGLYAAVGFAVIDPILANFRDGTDAAVVDAVMYAESLTFTLTLTDFVKIAVRRPRPLAYREQAELDAQYGGPGKGPAISDTDASLSFFSGHAATVASVGATATYLAFSRAPGTWRPWVTLVGSVALTSFVSVERVRAGEHFPTDVIAGALAGAGIGVLVPHLHRHESDGRSWMIGLAPAPAGTGLALHGSF